MKPELLEQINNLRYFEYGIKSVKGVNDYLAAGYAESPEVNWITYRIFKGVVAGIFERLRNEGSQLIANQILREEGLSQQLSPKQQDFLMEFDVKYSL